MLTLFSSSEKVLRVDKERSRASTSETDSSGGTRQQADESMRRAPCWREVQAAGNR